MEKKMHEDKGVLRVQMLGSFSVVWRGEQIAGGSRAKESQFTHLMQILLYYGEKGVSRNWLEEVLFGERDIGNIHHSLRSVLYNARKKLKEAGLPEVEYIWQRNGIFYWTDEIPVEKDTEHFESLCRRAEEAEDSEKKLDYLLDACYRYNGDFLPQQAGVIWAAQEARRLQSMFFACVEKAAVLLREREDWLRMKELGVYVTRVSPFADWEVITMEALVSMGCMAEARKLYDDTVESYMQELGCRPSRKLMELFDRLGTQMHHNYAMLDAIQSELQGEAEKSPGGYLRSWPVFQGIYQMVERFMERSGQSVYLMLCTIIDTKGNPLEDGQALEELSERLEEAVCKSIRHGDAVTKYGKGQYLVLLVNITREDCIVVQKRINSNFLVGRQRTKIRYYVNSVSCSGDR